MWPLASMHPERFAAIAQSAEVVSYVESHELVKNMPVWAFHGEKDTVVLAERSEEIVEALKVNRENVQFSFYPEAGHDFLDKNLRQSRAIRMVLKTYTLRLTN